MATTTKRRKDRLTPTQARAARRDRRTRRRRIIRFGAFISIAAISFLFVASLFAGSIPISFGTATGNPDLGEVFPEQPYSHIGFGEEHPPYNTVPASSGWHYAALPKWGIYDRFIPDETLVHNLEHGGVRIHYDCPDGCPDLVDRLADIARREREVVMSPYPDMGSKIALVAWTVVDKLDELDEERVVDFINAHRNSNRAPEFWAD